MRRLDTLGFRVGDAVRCRLRRSRPGHITRFEWSPHLGKVIATAVSTAYGGKYVFTSPVEDLEYMILDQLAIEASLEE